MAGGGDGRSGVALGHLEEDISFATRALRAVLRQDAAEFMATNQVAPGEIAILSLIGLNPGISQKDLAGTVVLKKSAMTKVLNALEAAGLVERRKGEGDSRLNALYLTERGEARRVRLRAAMDARQERILGGLTAGERAEFFRLLWRIVTDLDPARD